MNIDDAVRKAFELELEAVPVRLPGEAEVSRACIDHHSVPRRRLKPGDFVPVMAMAAAAAVALCLDPSSIMRLRPLASELVISLPDDAGSRFMDFVLEAGESYRSID